MELKEVLENVDFTGNPEKCNIQNITHDSRKVKPGTLFVAIKGLANDGHDYILDAVYRGASAVMSNGRSLSDIGVPVIKVNNPRKCMSVIADNFYHHPSRDIYITGITGTNGKTSITHMINFILNNADIPCGSLGTLGFSTPSGMQSTGFTTPESVDLHQFFSMMSHSDIKHTVMEVSSHALDLHRVDSVDFDMAIFTNLTPEHLDYHGTLENYFNAKMNLFHSLSPAKTAIINIDDDYGKRIKNIIQAKTITYGLSPSAEVFPDDVHMTMNETRATIKIGSEKIPIRTNFIGNYNLYNIMAALTAAYTQGVSPENIRKAFQILPPVPGRLENIPSSIPGKVFIDYAHTPDAYQQLLSMVRKLSSPETKIITLFGCGGERDRTKRPEMGRIASEISDHVVITSDNPRSEEVSSICSEIAGGITKNNFQVILNRKKALEETLGDMNDQSVLLVLGKGREEYEIIQNEKIYHSDVQIISQYRL